jgi:hypothetical protein
MFCFGFVACKEGDGISSIRLADRGTTGSEQAGKKSKGLGSRVECRSAEIRGGAGSNILGMEFGAFVLSFCIHVWY